MNGFVFIAVLLMTLLAVASYAYYCVLHINSDFKKLNTLDIEEKLGFGERGPFPEKFLSQIMDYLDLRPKDVLDRIFRNEIDKVKTIYSELRKHADCSDKIDLDKEEKNLIDEVQEQFEADKEKYRKILSGEVDEIYWKQGNLIAEALGVHGEIITLLDQYYPISQFNSLKEQIRKILEGYLFSIINRRILKRWNNLNEYIGDIAARSRLLSKLQETGISFFSVENFLVPIFGLHIRSSQKVINNRLIQCNIERCLTFSRHLKPDEENFHPGLKLNRKLEKIRHTSWLVDQNYLHLGAYVSARSICDLLKIEDQGKPILQHFVCNKLFPRELALRNIEISPASGEQPLKLCQYLNFKVYYSSDFPGYLGGVSFMPRQFRQTRLIILNDKYSIARIIYWYFHELSHLLLVQPGRCMLVYHRNKVLYRRFFKYRSGKDHVREEIEASLLGQELLFPTEWLNWLARQDKDINLEDYLKRELIGNNNNSLTKIMMLMVLRKMAFMGIDVSDMEKEIFPYENEKMKAILELFKIEPNNNPPINMKNLAYSTDKVCLKRCGLHGMIGYDSFY